MLIRHGCVGGATSIRVPRMQLTACADRRVGRAQPWRSVASSRMNASDAPAGCHVSDCVSMTGKVASGVHTSARRWSMSIRQYSGTRISWYRRRLVKRS